MDHYSKEAELHGVSGTCTIQDIRTRRLEFNAIRAFIRDGMRVCEVGCGNGFTAKELAKEFFISLDASDLNKDLVRLAQKNLPAKGRGSVNFSVKNVLHINENEKYNLVFTERCLQNLLSWKQQQNALEKLKGALTLGGTLVLIESFVECLNNLNKARAELDLPPISPPWYNHWFHEKKLLPFMRKIGFEYLQEENFLSGYYFGSRVLLPALYPKNKKVQSDSQLNNFFCGFPPVGGFGPMKLVAFKKVHSL